MIKKSDAEIIEEIYWLIGRADPTDADLRGAAIQVSWYIEEQRPELVEKVSKQNYWPIPFFKKEWPYICGIVK